MDGYLLLAEALCREGIKDHLAFITKTLAYGPRHGCNYELANFGHLQFCRCPWFDTYAQISTQKYNQLINYCDILGGIE